MVKLRTLASLVMLLAAVSLARASPLEVDAEEEAISPADSPLQGDESVQGGAVDNDQEDVKEGEEDDFLLDEQPIVESSEDIREDDEPVQIDPVTGARLYKGYKLIRSKPKTEEHLQILKFIANGIEDYWTPIPVNTTFLKHVDMLVGPSHFKLVASYLDCAAVPYEIVIQDIQDAIDHENPPVRQGPGGSYEDQLLGRPVHSLSKRQTSLGSLIRSFFGFDSKDLDDHPTKIRQGRHFNSPAAPPPSQSLEFPTVIASPEPVKTAFVSDELSSPPTHSFPSHEGPPPAPPENLVTGFCTTKSGFDWEQYHRLSKIEKYLDCLEYEHPDKVFMQEIGRSYENRRLRVMKIGRNERGIRKKAVWIDGGIHAREWISPAAVLYMIHQFVENYDEHRDIMDEVDIYILPVMNPDGYEYTFTNDRMWRKTRSNPHGHSGGRCVGADPNRNWEYRWGGPGASKNPCTETYMGTGPFSEAETRAASQFVFHHRKDIQLFLTFHSYGQFILYPWGHTNQGVPPNYRDLHSLGEVAGDAMTRASDRGNKYIVGSAAQVLYPAAGGSDDWAKGKAGIEYSYTVELPDEGEYGFLLPYWRIKSSVKEAFAGTKAMIKELIRRKRG